MWSRSRARRLIPSLEQYPETLLTGARREVDLCPDARCAGLEGVKSGSGSEINPVTAKKYDIIDGEMIGIQTPRGRIKIKAKVTDDILPGVVSFPRLCVSQL